MPCPPTISHSPFPPLVLPAPLRSFFLQYFNSNELDDLLHVLPTPPPTTLRYNSLCGRGPDKVLEIVKEAIGVEGREHVRWYGRGLSDVIYWKSDSIVDAGFEEWKKGDCKERDGERIWVDRRCGEAVLRGAEVFAPGVLAMGRQCEVGNIVEVWVDVEGRITKGSVRYHDGNGRWEVGTGGGVKVGKGMIMMGRNMLWPKKGMGNGLKRGIAIKMVQRVFGGPAISGKFGGDVYAQNLSSTVVGHVLRVSRGMLVVDLCASPGGKTGHVAALMENEGRIVAFDKSEKKVAELRRNMERLSVKIVECYVGNSTLYRKYLKNGRGDTRKPEYGIELDAESVDRVIVDPPCSALGIRPRLKVEVNTVEELERHAKYQRMFLKAAVRLCKVGGLISYSTCTINPLENEGNARWMLDNFPVKLVEQNPSIGVSGRRGAGLSEKECAMVQRFDPSSKLADTPGFFIALFRKIEGVPAQ